MVWYDVCMVCACVVYCVGIVCLWSVSAGLCCGCSVYCVVLVDLCHVEYTYDIVDFV